MHLTQAEFASVRRILGSFLPVGCRAYSYGSRVHGRGLKPYSDLDLCLRASTKLPSALIADLREAFAQSDLTFRVDIVDWHALSVEFQRLIESDLAEIEI